MRQHRSLRDLGALTAATLTAAVLLASCSPDEAATPGASPESSTGPSGGPTDNPGDAPEAPDNDRFTEAPVDEVPAAAIREWAAAFNDRERLRGRTEELPGRNMTTLKDASWVALRLDDPDSPQMHFGVPPERPHKDPWTTTAEDALVIYDFKTGQPVKGAALYETILAAANAG